MPMGAGKYDDATTLVRQLTSAKGVILIVFGGVHGDGFSAQANMETTLALPDILERVAKDMRENMRQEFTDG